MHSSEELDRQLKILAHIINDKYKNYITKTNKPMKKQSQKQRILTMLLEDNLVTQKTVAKKLKNPKVQVRTRISQLKAAGVKVVTFNTTKGKMYELNHAKTSHKLISKILA